MTRTWPNCGASISGSDPESPGETVPEAADGFTAGRRGDLLEVPPVYEKSPSRAGLWKHGWRLGNAVRAQMGEQK